MSDLISRQNAIEGVKELFACADIGNDECDITYMLENLPSADRPQGEWEIETDTDEYGLKRPKLVCSKCKKEPAAWDLTELFEFCPNCGARMYKGGDNG